MTLGNQFRKEVNGVRAVLSLQDAQLSHIQRTIIVILSEVQPGQWHGGDIFEQLASLWL